MAPKNTESSVLIQNGPSREDLIFRGLTDGQEKTFCLNFTGNKRYVEILIHSVEWDPQNQHGRADRHCWKLSGRMHFTLTQPVKNSSLLLQWVDFTAEYNSNLRGGILTADAEYIRQLFLGE